MRSLDPIPHSSEYAVRLANALRNHVHKEDILSEMIAGGLTAEDDARIIAEFEEIDREFQQEDNGQTLDQLRMLEWKYLRRTS